MLRLSTAAPLLYHAVKRSAEAIAIEGVEH